MTFIACGLNHKTAPIELRERLCVADEHSQAALLARLYEHPAIEEAALLSTCNRIEFYCITEDPDCLIPWIAGHFELSADILTSHIYCLKQYEGIKHAMRVACGLDSMMLGEPQILGQMKKAYQLAEKIGTLGQKLRPIFHHIFSASKRIRTQTQLGISPISVAYAGANLIFQRFNISSDLKVLLIGSGETNQLIAKYLFDAGIKHFTVASRTLDNANTLAKTLAGHSLTIADIPQSLAKADIVISATACPLPFISVTLVKKALNERNQRPMFLLDLAVPRDIEAEVNQINHVHLYNVDDLQEIIQEGLNSRQQAASEAEAIIDHELNDYIRWSKTQKSNHLITQYRQKTHYYAHKEIERALTRIHNGDNIENCFEEFAHRLIHKITHQPTVGLRRAARDGRQDVLDLTSYLFEE